MAKLSALATIIPWLRPLNGRTRYRNCSTADAVHSLSIYQGNEPNTAEPEKWIAKIAFLLVPAATLHLARPAMVAGHQSSPPCRMPLLLRVGQIVASLT